MDLPADDAEAEHAAHVVEDLEPLAAAGGSTGQGYARPPPLLSPDRRSQPREIRAELAAPRDPARAAASAWQLGPARAAPWCPHRGPPAGRAAATCDGRRSAVLVREEEGWCYRGRRSAVGVDPRVDWDRSDLNPTAPLLFRVEPLRPTSQNEE